MRDVPTRTAWTPACASGGGHREIIATPTVIFGGAINDGMIVGFTDERDAIDVDADVPADSLLGDGLQHRLAVLQDDLEIDLLNAVLLLLHVHLLGDLDAQVVEGEP
jgi:hypothetical protein